MSEAADKKKKIFLIIVKNYKIYLCKYMKNELSQYDPAAYSCEHVAFEAREYKK